MGAAKVFAGFSAGREKRVGAARSLSNVAFLAEIAEKS